MLSESYLPAVMQAIAYYVELLQYEVPEMTTIEPPFSLSEGDDTDSSNRPPPTPQMTTQSTIESTTHGHKPGYYAPPAPPIREKPIVGVLKPAQTFPKPEKPLIGLLPLLSISSSDYFDWYLNNIKFKNSPQISGKNIKYFLRHSDFFFVHLYLYINVKSILIRHYFYFHFSFFTIFLTEYILQDLNLLPSGLIQDIAKEHYEQPALLDTENVNEFLKVYDDFYSQRNQPVTGRKKIPPTKPYVQMLMLYDLLKREAKKQMLNKFVVIFRLFFSFFFWVFYVNIIYPLYFTIIALLYI